jgi:hypothetical protein
MRVGALFDVIIASHNVLDHLVGVDNREQLISRLERLKRQGTDVMLRDMKELRAAVTALLNDQLEMSASMPGDEESGIPEIETLGEAAEAEQGSDDLESRALDRELEEIGNSLRPPDSRSLEDELSEIDGSAAGWPASPEPPGAFQPVLLTPDKPEVPRPPASPPAEVFIPAPQPAPESPNTLPAAAPEKPNS